MNKTKNIFLFLAMIIAFNVSKAQPQKKLWSLPYSYLKFNASPGTPLLLPSDDYVYATGNQAHNAMHDYNGNLLFFISKWGGNDYTVFDKNGKLIGNLSYNGVPVSGSSEIAIVPVPNDCNKYYLIVPINEVAAYSNTYGKFGYVTLDISVPSGNGALGSLTNNGVVTFLKETLNFALKGIFPEFAVTPLRAATNDRLLFAWQGGTLYKFLVTQTGFTELASSGTDILPVSWISPVYKNELEVIALSTGNYRLGYAGYSEVAVADFTSSGILVANSAKKVDLTGGRNVYGLEFSANGTYLYVAHALAPYLQYIDATQATLTSTSLGSLSNASLFGSGQIELGYDEKLYFANTAQLGALSLNTNGSPITTSWTPTAVTGLGMGAAYLNDQIDGEVYFSPSPTITGNNYACSTSPETYTLGGSYSPNIVYTWTITGGTPTSFNTIGTASSLPITWPSTGGTITVTPVGAGGCSPAAVFTVNQCCRKTATTIVYLNDKTETSPITYNGNASTIYMINGIYTINSNVTFNNCQTYLGLNAQVNVSPGAVLNITNNSIWQAGCNAMWNGIVLNFTGGTKATLLVDNSTIQDAKLAIDSKGGSPLTVQTGSKLNLNFRNILLETFTGTHPAIIKGSTISCTVAGVPSNTLLSPYSTVQGFSGRTYSGIELNYVNTANIGDASSAVQTNYFNNMNFGIYNSNTGNLTVYNNDFTNIIYIPSYSKSGRCIHSENTVANTAGGTITVGGAGLQANNFTNSKVGILTDYNQNIHITYNTFNNLSNAGVYIYRNTYSTDVASVLNNTFNDCQTSIYGYWLGGSQLFDVTDNNINLAAPTANSKPNSTAIYIANATLGTISQYFTILNNTIKRVSAGIQVTYYNSPNIKNNTLSDQSDLGQSVLSNGILVTNCPNVNIESNLVKGLNAQNSWWMTAIRLEPGCTNATVLYNGVEDIGRGLFFSGTLTGTQVSVNNMKNTFDGILLNSGAIIGDQLLGKASENTWQGTSARSDIYSYLSDGTYSPMNILDPSVIPGYTSDMKTWNTVISQSSAFPAQPVTTSQSSTRAGYTGVHRSMLKKDHDQLVKIAKDKIEYPVYNESAKWWAKYNLYNMIMADSSLQTDEPDLISFADSADAATMGTLYQINQSINNGSASLTAATTNSISANNTMEQNLKDVYSIIIASRNNNGLNSSEINNLKTIAALCPYESGPAVYNARVLLSSIDNTVYVNTCEIAPPSKQKSMEQKSPNSNNVSTVFPNPANDKLNVTIHLEQGQTGSLLVYDLAGKLLLSHTLNENSDFTEISTTKLSAGMYIYKINLNNNVADSGKLSIIR